MEQSAVLLAHGVHVLLDAKLNKLVVQLHVDGTQFVFQNVFWVKKRRRKRKL